MLHIFVDAHVHIHSCFRLEALFTSALGHFHTLKQEIRAAQTAGFLLLTESAGAGVFANLQAHCAADQGSFVAGFQVEQSGEAETLVVRNRFGAELYLVAGRQIVTAERLEVLALGCRAPFPDGRPLDQVLDQLTAIHGSTDSAALAHSCGPLVVLPWGVGKWLGKRRQKVEELVARLSAHAIFLGDNGNRPFFWPLPALFQAAQARGVRNLPGSDPLPLSGQEEKVGGFGLRLTGAIDPQAPFSSLCALLRNPAVPLTPYGRCEQLYPFVKHQLSMQRHKNAPFSP